MTLTYWTQRLPLLPGVLALALAPAAGCNGGPKTSATTGDSETETGTTGDTDDSTAGMTSTTMGPGTTAGPGGTDSGTESSTGTTATTTTATGPTSDPTTSPTEPSTGPDTDSGGVNDACVAGCQTVVECDPGEGPVEECIAACNDEFSEGGPECVAVFQEYIDCLMSAPCDDILDGLACEGLADATEEACNPGGECAEGGEAGPDGCAFFLECADESFSVSCENDSCECFYNDEPTGDVCQVPNACGDGGGPDLLEDCCGFALP